MSKKEWNLLFIFYFLTFNDMSIEQCSENFSDYEAKKEQLEKQSLLVEFVEKEIGEIKERIIEIRREIHQHPELGFQEFETSKIIIDHLKNLGIDEVYENISGTGVVGILKGEKSEKAVLLRADMDALPIPEESGEKFSSQEEGVSHACGHDAHAAALLGAAETLKQVKELYGLNGDVIFAFQPNEERTVKKSGAVAIMKFLAEKGLWEKISSVFACHVAANVPMGTVRLHAGVFLSGSARFNIVINGPGGHGARVNEVPNPTVLGANMINKISIEFGGIEPEESLRKSIVAPTVFHSGQSKNIIPAQAELGGTIRILENGDDAKLEKKEIFHKIKKIVEEIIDPWKESGANYEIGFDTGTRPLCYTEEMIDKAKSIASQSIPDVKFLEKQSPASDDVSFFFEKFRGKQIPGFYYSVGAANPEKGIPPCQHHQSKFRIDEDVIPQMISLLTNSVLESLR